jgi:hypothetical protein
MQKDSIGHIWILEVGRSEDFIVILCIWCKCLLCSLLHPWLILNIDAMQIENQCVSTPIQYTKFQVPMHLQFCVSNIT